jgi:hypothetical protein
MTERFTAIKNLLHNRLFLLVGTTGIILVVHYCFTGVWIPAAEVSNTWFYSGIFMVLFSILFIEPFFTSPKNIFMNVIPLILMLLPIRDSFQNLAHWNFFMVALLLLLASSIAIFFFADEDKSPEDPINQRIDSIKKVLLKVGKAKNLYTVVFFYFLIVYYADAPVFQVTMLAIWLCIILFVDPTNTNLFLLGKIGKGSQNQIGTIIGVDSDNLFLAKLFKDKSLINKFEVVKFKHAHQMDPTTVNYGVILDLYSQNFDRIAKVLYLKSEQRGREKWSQGGIYSLNNEEITPLSLRVDEIVGIVCEGSSVDFLKFHYSQKNHDLQQGNLIELALGEKKLFYQVLDGAVTIEKLAGMDATGGVIGMATQLGEWIPEKTIFAKVGWVPGLNTPVFKANDKNLRIEKPRYPYFEIGKIPNTALPVVINLADAVSHHTAIIGVTGSGKSYLTREILEQLKQDTKIVFIDYNNEFKRSFKPQPEDILGNQVSSRLVELLLPPRENEKPAKIIKGDVLPFEEEYGQLVKERLINFIQDENCRLKLFETPDIDNYEVEADYQVRFLEILYKFARGLYIEGNNTRICLVIEEAHSILPEHSKKSLIEPIRKIALQGRKYGLGLIVITQRTANIAKDILSQCNTMICLRSFDDSNKNHMAGYVGGSISDSISGLKPYQALVVGKALNSTTPLIVDTYRTGE